MEYKYRGARLPSHRYLKQFNNHVKIVLDKGTFVFAVSID